MIEENMPVLGRVLPRHHLNSSIDIEVFTVGCRLPLFTSPGLHPMSFSCPTPTQDVLDWLKDWGNQFNKMASAPSFVEHLVALSKVQSSLERHLSSFTPPMTSSHDQYEKTCKNYIDTYFPQRFQSYRAFDAAVSFRRKMLEAGLWESWLAWCNLNVDFQKAATLDNTTIFKICAYISKKFLSFARSCKSTSGKAHDYGWGHLVLCRNSKWECQTGIDFCLGFKASQLYHHTPFNIVHTLIGWEQLLRAMVSYKHLQTANPKHALSSKAFKYILCL